ncbi:MAG: DMT family transporter [Arenicella sp.]|nr:DMT family transporter [Arenicella sp.]
MKNPILINGTLLLIAFIWGFGFVPQRMGLEYLDANAFNATRFALGALTLLPVLLLLKSVTKAAAFNLPTLMLGVGLGFLLFGGAYFQQTSLEYTTVANVAFITGLYVIIVPTIGYFLGHRYRAIVWIGAFIAIGGLYLMTGSSSEISLRGDLLALVGAVFWALHILALARKAGAHNQLVLAFYQFMFCALFSAVFSLLVEPKLIPDSFAAWQWPLINGVFVVGIAYTLQVWVMDHAEPFLASLILALEAVFGAMAGYLVLSERLVEATMVGAVMMLVGCILAQLPGSETSIDDSVAAETD